MTDQPQTPYQQPAPMNPSDEKLWSTLVHVGGIFFHFLPALIGYLLLKDRGPFVREHTRAALNFQLTLLFAYILGGILLIVVVGFFVIIAAAILNIVFSIIAAVAANNGQTYRYPLAIELVK
ncbi:MAG: uncharacterized protein QOF79_3039 [Actinomycetota bacterium]|jgi:uncharacterized Tic20 family protein|nr:uncharacterized protein [Actinomycetota bacterium]